MSSPPGLRAALAPSPARSPASSPRARALAGRRGASRRTRPRATPRDDDDDDAAPDDDPVDPVVVSIPRAPSINAVGSAARTAPTEARPLFTIGLFADAQYADADDREAKDRRATKRFRDAPARLAEAFRSFRGDRSETMACVVNLGDLVDGVTDDDLGSAFDPDPVDPDPDPRSFPIAEGGPGGAEEPVSKPVHRKPVVRRAFTRRRPTPPGMLAKNRADLRRMAEVIRENAGPLSSRVYHCLGNHDLCVPRAEALELLGQTRLGAYFTAALPRNWRLVVLDTTELNPRFADEVGGREQREMERNILDRMEKKANGGEGGGAESIMPWGGGVSETQVGWLRGVLADAERANERVIVASHCALSRTSARPGMFAWNADEVSEILERSPAVALCLAGHDHAGGYGRTLVRDARDSNLYVFGRVHHVTLEAMLEAPEGSNAWAVLEVYPHEARVVADGTAATSRRLRTSEWGRFTGVASFGRVADIAEEAVSAERAGGGGGKGGGAGGGARVETSDMGLVEWINANRGRMDGGGGTWSCDDEMDDAF